MDRRDYEEIERREGRGSRGGAAVAMTLIKWSAIVFIVLVLAYLVRTLASVIESVL